MADTPSEGTHVPVDGRVRAVGERGGEHMVTVDQSEAPVDLVGHDDGVIDDWIASLTPDEF